MGNYSKGEEKVGREESSRTGGVLHPQKIGIKGLPVHHREAPLATDCHYGAYCLGLKGFRSSSSEGLAAKCDLQRSCCGQVWNSMGYSWGGEIFTSRICRGAMRYLVRSTSEPALFGLTEA